MRTASAHSAHVTPTPSPRRVTSSLVVSTRAAVRARSPRKHASPNAPYGARLLPVASLMACARRTKLIHPGERELHLRLDGGGPQHPALRLRRPGGQVVQQGRLADTRFAVHDQGAALPGEDRGHQIVEEPALGTAAGRPGDVQPGGHVSGHLHSTTR